MKKTTYIVMKNEIEISRHTSKHMADVVALQIGGYIVKYTKEWK